MSTEPRLLVRQCKGMAGRPWQQRLILKGLGLNGPGSEVTVANERAIRGMIRKVLHLVEVSSAGAAPKAAAGKAPTAKAPAAKAPVAKAAPAKKAAPRAAAKGAKS
jgi:large subunit ribosomal protein L30